jgi:hypothetical protein
VNGDREDVFDPTNTTFKEPTMQYRVTWTIDIDADNPEAAAREALEIQRDPMSIAVSFDVTDKNGNKTTVDLQADEVL